MIEFICCGDRKIVHNLYDCNMIGDYEMIQSILNKCLACKDHMEDHVYKPGNSKTNDDTWYTKYSDIIGYVGCSMTGIGSGSYAEVWYNRDTYWKRNNNFLMGYVTSLYATDALNDITNILVKSKKRGATKKFADKLAPQLYGSKSDLENWKYFVFNNKLPLFLNIVLTINQNNTSKPYMPWLVDKQYTDEEINELFDFSPEEIALIDKTIKKFERNSPWFKRLVCGTNADK